MSAINHVKTIVAAGIVVLSPTTAFNAPQHIALKQLQTTRPSNLQATVLKDDRMTIIENNPHDEQNNSNNSQSLNVRIHGTWYDLKGWRKAHPAGSHWIDWYDGRDATEVMDAFHSQRARAMYAKLPKTSAEDSERLELSAAEDTSVQRNFRQLLRKLEHDGWWDRDFGVEYRQLGIWAGLVTVAAALVPTVPLASFFLLSLAMTNAGWLGHDYIHGVDSFSARMRNFGALANGLSPLWWSDKHNKHHALTNEIGVDEDIATDPILYIWAPDPKNDSWLRKIQHRIYLLPLSFMFAYWRFDSIKSVLKGVELKRPNAKAELYSLIAHYAIMLTLFPPLTVFVPAIFFSGLVSALIVTPTHQSEELFTEYQSDWVAAQFRSTRNARLTNFFSTWLWGGMQYQLEHHLFPSMPRMRYPALRPILQTFAVDNNIPGGYRESGEWEILKDNWLLYKRVGEADAVEGAPASQGMSGQIGAICDHTLSPASSSSTTS